MELPNRGADTVLSTTNGSVTVDLDKEGVPNGVWRQGFSESLGCSSFRPLRIIKSPPYKVYLDRTPRD